MIGKIIQHQMSRAINDFLQPGNPQWFFLSIFCFYGAVGIEQQAITVMDGHLELLWIVHDRFETDDHILRGQFDDLAGRFFPQQSRRMSAAGEEELFAAASTVTTCAVKKDRLG